MSKTVIFYTPKEVRELKNIKRTTKRGAERNAAIKEWAAKHNRKESAVYMKMCTLKVGKQRVRTPRVNAPVLSVKDTQSFMSGITFRIPIKTMSIVDNHFIITT